VELGKPGFCRNPLRNGEKPKKPLRNLAIVQEKSIICPNSSTFQCFFDNLSKKHRKAEELVPISTFSINYGLPEGFWTDFLIKQARNDQF